MPPYAGRGGCASNHAASEPLFTITPNTDSRRWLGQPVVGLVVRTCHGWEWWAGRFAGPLHAAFIGEGRLLGKAQRDGGDRHTLIAGVIFIECLLSVSPLCSVARTGRRLPHGRRPISVGF